MDVHLGPEVVVGSHGNLLNHVVVTRNKRLASEDPGGGAHRYIGISKRQDNKREQRTMICLLEQVVVSHDRSVVKGARHTLVVRVVDEISGSEVQASESSNSSTNAEAGHGEEETRFLRVTSALACWPCAQEPGT
jgi:hypothetical protein